jgi:hypothetical protein
VYKGVIDGFRKILQEEGVRGESSGGDLAHFPYSVAPVVGVAPIVGVVPVVGAVSDVCRWRCADNALALYKGGLARVIRSSPQFAVTLAAYELLHKHFPYPFAPQELTAPRPTRAIAQDIVSSQEYRLLLEIRGLHEEC